MPDLGTYAVWVLSAYGVSLSLLAAIVIVSIWQARRTRQALERMEEGRARSRAPGADEDAVGGAGKAGAMQEPANG